MTSCASASVHAAPPMSFFISAIPADGLMSRPPVSKQTPLPISVTFGCVGSPQTKSTSRGLQVEACPTAWMAGNPRRNSSPTISCGTAPCSRAIRIASAASRSGVMSDAGVLTRSRASAVAPASCRTWAWSTADGAMRRARTAAGCVDDLVGVEPVAAIGPAQRERAGCSDGEFVRDPPVGTGRQALRQPCHVPEFERVQRRQRAETESRPARRAVGRRQQQHLVTFCLETRRGDPGSRGRILGLQPAGQVGLEDEREFVRGRGTRGAGLIDEKVHDGQVPLRVERTQLGSLAAPLRRRGRHGIEPALD